MPSSSFRACRFLHAPKKNAWRCLLAVTAQGSRANPVGVTLMPQVGHCRYLPAQGPGACFSFAGHAAIGRDSNPHGSKHSTVGLEKHLDLRHSSRSGGEACNSGAGEPGAPRACNDNFLHIKLVCNMWCMYIHIYICIHSFMYQRPLIWKLPRR